MIKVEIILGGAGFIGYNLAQRLIKNNSRVFIIDNLSNAIDPKFLLDLEKSECTLLNIDIVQQKDELRAFIRGILKEHGSIDTIWHMAANSDIPAGIEDINVDLKDTFSTTLSILDVLGFKEVKNFNFASSSAVYGDHGVTLLKEDTALRPISNYGVFKAASELLIHCNKEKFSKVNIFRFPNVVGAPSTHGVIHDFVKKLRKNNEFLKVLGNGTQRKCYLHVEDLVQTMLHVMDKSDYQYLVVNIGPEDNGVRVSEIAEMVVEYMSSRSLILYGNKPYGWKGDVPSFQYDVRLLNELGIPSLSSSKNAVRRAIVEIINQDNYEIN